MTSWQTRITNFVLRRMKPTLAKKEGDQLVSFLRNQMAMSGDKTSKNTIIDKVSIGGVGGEWVSVGDVPSNKALVYFHGGAYVSGSPVTHRDYAAAMAKALGIKVLMVDYRLAPEYSFPAPIEDALVVYKALLGEGYAANDLLVGGDSAGGNLTLCLLQKIRSFGLSMPAAACLFSPWADLTHAGNSMLTNANSDPMLPMVMLERSADIYAAGADKNDPLISPIFTDMTDFPPMIIHVGSTEILLDDAKTIADLCEQTGVDVTLKIWEKAPHAFPIMVKFLPEARAAIEQTAEFFRTKLNP
jgi:acetyl esterase/lipase|tara:strand:- start:8120 stop:9022 length:903 start_codon:yes stop_codon:yes gene_type:complete